ncbi:cytochrome C [Sulfurimonas paralvinellae]|uniref:Cytochrome C n=1 Tax=Sulfurimonas paralvinellae TaxID=317658 RepID=A0A7M1B966_9BACT|nr:cytochrome C [Sulfurimonas paralvinellae]QOP46267.1 cytochrome C [Sulfurimonas paralvinellae]
MKKTTSLLLAAILAGSVFTATASADASKGKRFYMKKLRHACKKDGIKNGAMFAIKHDRRGWAEIKESNKLQQEWTKVCSHGKKKIKKMRKKDINNLYDFVWKYASDGETPSCG